MNRAWVTGMVALALALPSWGQFRGAPASVTSMAPGRGAAPGPPASVTSLGPRGFSSGQRGLSPGRRGFSSPCSGTGPLIPSAMGCTSTQFTSGYFFPDARNRGPVNLRPNSHRGFWPVYVPYAYPAVVAAEPEPEAAVDPDPPAPTIFEHRATMQRLVPAPRPTESQATATPAASEPVGDAREQIPILLVYRDGHEQEVNNYAIVGSTLYDLGTFVAHKIPLAELNLKATVKANDDRGVEFAVPSSVKLD